MSTKTKTNTIQPTERNYSVEDRGQHVLGKLTSTEAIKLCFSMPGSEVVEHGKGGRVTDRLSYIYVTSFYDFERNTWEN